MEVKAAASVNERDLRGVDALRKRRVTKCALERSFTTMRKYPHWGETSWPRRCLLYGAVIRLKRTYRQSFSCEAAGRGFGSHGPAIREQEGISVERLGSLLAAYGLGVGF
jgi:hypothetical protein